MAAGWLQRGSKSRVEQGFTVECPNETLRELCYSSSIAWQTRHLQNDLGCLLKRKSLDPWLRWRLERNESQLEPKVWLLNFKLDGHQLRDPIYSQEAPLISCWLIIAVRKPNGGFESNLNDIKWGSRLRVPASTLN